MVITDEYLEKFIASLTHASEDMQVEGAPTYAQVDLAMLQIALSVAEELRCFRDDYPDVLYSKVMQDQYGERGEQ